MTRMASWNKMSGARMLQTRSIVGRTAGSTAVLSNAHRTFGVLQQRFSSAQPLEEEIWVRPEYPAFRHADRLPTQLSPTLSPSLLPLPADFGPRAVENDHEELKVEAKVSPKTLSYGSEGEPMPILSKLHIVAPKEDTPSGIWPVFRLMDEEGTFRDPACDGDDSPQLSRLSSPSLDDLPTGDLAALRARLAHDYPHQQNEIESCGLLQESKNAFAETTQSHNTLLHAHRLLIRLRTMDEILLAAHRQGRISFYMTCRGEEAIHAGVASATDVGDPVFAQYREQGILMWRGFTLEQFCNQCFSNDLDLGKGRQMPVHYGSRALNYHTISSPLGTQLVHAVGAAYRLKLTGTPNVALALFGDGCSSTVDFHSALNFAATLKAPVLFICRNNGYAISTPASEQFAGDGVVARAPGYGMAGIRCDGNDVFAVHAAIREAKAYALKNSAPVLIEAITYRLGHHSTSDDSTRYRCADDVDDVATTFDPMIRLESFLKHYHQLNDEDISTIQNEERRAVLQAMEQAEQRAPPDLSSMFEEVYKDMPPHLQEQQEALNQHLAKYHMHYK